MNKIKSLCKYVLIYIITVAILLGLLVLAAKLPRDKIKANIKDSIEFYKENDGIEILISRRDYSYVHYYADAILLNIIYNIDEDKPLESVLWANYYETVKADVNNDFIKVVEEDLKANQQYLRYWHGEIAMLSPLLIMFNMQQIYVINRVLLYGLVITLLVVLFIKNKKLAIIYLISMIMIAFPVVPLLFEYSWTFYIMLIVSILATLLEKRGNDILYKLFFITGIVTCYLDFLTTEIITVLVPLLFILYLRKEEGRLTNIKETIKFVMVTCILWFTGYALMWGAKWLIASLALGINALSYVTENALHRVNGLQGLESRDIIYKNVIWRNTHALYPINAVKKVSTVWKIYTGILFAMILSFDWKNIKKKWLILIILGISLIPYIRYFILANHSYMHSFFTFRSQMITIIGIGIIILECLNYKLLLKDINLKEIWRGKWKKSN